MAKKIELKTVPVTIQRAEASDLDYAAHIATILQQPQGQGGVSMQDILTVGPVLEKANAAIKAKASHLILEDAEYLILMERLGTFQFGIVHQTIVEFIRDLQAAEPFEVGTTTGLA